MNTWRKASCRWEHQRTGQSQIPGFCVLNAPPSWHIDVYHPPGSSPEFQWPEVLVGFPCLHGIESITSHTFELNVQPPSPSQRGAWYHGAQIPISSHGWSFCMADPSPDLPPLALTWVCSVGQGPSVSNRQTPLPLRKPPAQAPGARTGQILHCTTLTHCWKSARTQVLREGKHFRTAMMRGYGSWRNEKGWNSEGLTRQPE